MNGLGRGAKRGVTQGVARSVRDFASENLPVLPPDDGDEDGGVASVLVASTFCTVIELQVLVSTFRT